MTRVEYVWMIEENTRAQLMNLGAHTSVVRFTLLGHVHEVVVGNDEFEFIGEEGNDED